MRFLTDRERAIAAAALRRAAEMSRFTASTIVANGRFTELSEKVAGDHRDHLLVQADEQDKLASAIELGCVARDHCRCGVALTARALAGRPTVYAAPAPGCEVIKCGDIELVAIQLPPNCSINLDVDVTRGDPPAPAFIRIKAGPSGCLEVSEDDRG